MLESIGKNNIKALILEGGKPLNDQFDPRTTFSLHDIEKIDRKLAWPDYDSNNKRVFETDLTINRAIIAQVLGVTTEEPQLFNMLVNTSLSKVSSWVEYRNFSVLERIYKNDNPSYWITRKDYLQVFKKEIEMCLKLVDETYEGVQPFLDNAFKYKLIFPEQNPITISQGNNHWEKMKFYFQNIETLEPDIAETEMDSISNWAFRMGLAKSLIPEMINQIPIRSSLWSKWRQNLDDYRRRTNIKKFAQLGAGLTLLSAERIDFSNQGIDLTFPAANIEPQISMMPVKRYF